MRGTKCSNEMLVRSDQLASRCPVSHTDAECALQLHKDVAYLLGCEDGTFGSADLQRLLATAIAALSQVRRCLHDHWLLQLGDLN